LSKLRSQANVGGARLDNTGAPLADYMMATKAQVGFTVLVEIKTPLTALLGPRYRNRAYQIGTELAGGVAQLQAECRLWAEEGAQQRDNALQLDRKGIHTYQPKGILIIGNTNQLQGDTDQVSTFELFRRNLYNPEVLTFDELLTRAKLILDTATGEQTEADQRR
jgi:hypothetical protein